MDLKLKFDILDVEAKAKSILKKKKRILFSYSGGKDSDILLDLFKKLNLLNNVKIVFFDTGIEWNAQKKHILKRIDEGFNIEIIRAFKPVSLCSKQYGEPFVSKYVSEMLSRLQKHNFDFQNDGKLTYPELIIKFPKCLGGLRWWCNYYGSKYDTNNKNKENYGGSFKSSFNIARNKYLKEFLIKYGLPFKVTNKCCHYSKKMTSHKFEKEYQPDLIIHGVRKAEGGIRSKKYKACFLSNKNLYMPIFWWNNQQMDKYKKEFNIKLSDCYEIYNLKRTGCAGCPFGRELNFERKQLKKYEPNLSLGVENIFKNTYLWSEKYNKFKLKD